MPIRIVSTKAARLQAEAEARARAEWLAYREAILDDMAEGKSITAARRAEAARLRAAAPKP